MEQGRIHSVDLLAMALETAKALGYRVREEAGFPAGACEVYGQKWLFLDPTLGVRERLQLVLDAIAGETAATLEAPAPLAAVLKGLRAA